MEQLRTIAKTIRGMKEEPDGSSTPVVAQLSVPVKTEGHNEFGCVVDCPEVLDSPKEIFGVDSNQALALAEMFIRSLWESRGIDAQEA